MSEQLTKVRVSDTHEWRLDCWEWRIGDPWTWCLYYIAPGSEYYIRPADSNEARLLDATKRLVEEARGITVD